MDVEFDAYLHVGRGVFAMGFFHTEEFGDI